MKKKDVNKNELKKFGCLIGILFPVLIGWIIPALTGHGLRFWTLILGIIFLNLSIFTPNLLFYPYKFWMKIGHILGWINGKLILSMIYVIILIPISAVMRITSYDPLKKKFNNLNTYKENIANKEIDLTRVF